MKAKSSAKGTYILAMAIWGTLAVFVRGIPLGSGALALCRAVLAVVLLGGWILLSKRRVPLPSLRRSLPLLLLSGAAIGFNWMLLFEAYRYTTVSIATLSYYFAPVLVTAACPLLFHEPLTRRQVLCFLGSTAGVVLILSASGLGSGGDDAKGIFFGLGAAVLYAAAVLLNKCIAGIPGLHRTLFQFLAAIVVLAPYVALTGGLRLEALDFGGWWRLLVVGFLHTGLSYLLYFSSLRSLRGQEAALLSYLDPLVAVLASLVLLGEPLYPLQALGGALVLGFALLNEQN